MMQVEKRMEQKLTFGQWVQQKRMDQGLTLQELAGETGVYASTINRIENGRTKATLATAIRICESLGVDLWELLRALKGRESFFRPDSETTISYRKNVLVLDDVKAFLSLFYENRPRVQELLAKLINLLYFRLLTQERSIAQATPRLDMDDAEKLLANSPLYQFRFKYPFGMKGQTILEIYRQGGVLTYSDLLNYVNSLLKDLYKNKYSPYRLKILLSRVEGGVSDRVLLDDVLSLDEDFARGGEVLGMYWNLVSFNNEIILYRGKHLALERYKNREPINEITLVDQVITISRWLQFLDWQDTSWLDDFRREVASGRGSSELPQV